MVKLSRMGMPMELLKMVDNWLENRKACLIFGEKQSDTFDVHIGLPQGSSLSPYLFVVFHCDLVKCLEAHSGHLFADDLSVLIKPPIMKRLDPMIQFLEKEGSRVCDQIHAYSIKWKQPINISKTVAQIFQSQVRRPQLTVTMNKKELEFVKEFKYLGFTWTDRLSLRPTVDRCLGNIRKALGKLKWLTAGRKMSSKALRQCFFAFTFPHFAWLFPFFPLLPQTQQTTLQQKFRAGLRVVHRRPFISPQNILTLKHEQPLEFYVKKYLQRRLSSVHRTELGSSLFFEDIFLWNEFHKRKNDHMGHFFRGRRVKRLTKYHESFLLKWFAFLENK